MARKKAVDSFVMEPIVYLSNAKYSGSSQPVIYADTVATGNRVAGFINGVSITIASI